MAETKTLNEEGAVAEAITFDPLVAAVEYVGNVTVNDSHKAIDRLIDEVDINWFTIGGVLERIRANAWYDESSFREYVTVHFAERGVGYRKAMYLITIYLKLTELNIPFAEAREVGWTKLRDLVPFLTDKNWQEWFKKAKSVTSIGLAAQIKELTGNATPSEISDKIHTSYFKLHEDQKETVNSALAKVKKDAGTHDNSVALEMMAASYLAGAPLDTSKASPDTVEVEDKSALVKLVKSVGWMAILEAFDEAFPSIKLDVMVPPEMMAEAQKAGAAVEETPVITEDEAEALLGGDVVQPDFGADDAEAAVA